MHLLIYNEVMSTNAQNLLLSFNALPETEQREVAAEILRRVTQLDSAPLSDEELTLSAEDVFLEFDRREEENAS